MEYIGLINITKFIFVGCRVNIERLNETVCKLEERNKNLQAKIKDLESKLKGKDGNFDEICKNMSQRFEDILVREQNSLHFSDNSIDIQKSLGKYFYKSKFIERIRIKLL